MSILESKNWPNLKTNWYKHFTIQFKHFIDVKFDLFFFSVQKNTKWPKIVPERGKITKSAIIQQICPFGI